MINYIMWREQDLWTWCWSLAKKLCMINIHSHFIFHSFARWLLVWHTTFNGWKGLHRNVERKSFVLVCGSVERCWVMKIQKSRQTIIWTRQSGKLLADQPGYRYFCKTPKISVRNTQNSRRLSKAWETSVGNVRTHK